MPDPLTFNQFVDLLRIRLGRADAVKDPGELHSFKGLMTDYAEGIPVQWYWEAFETLDGRGHLHEQSMLGNNHDALGRLSPAGREHLRALGEL